MMYSTAVFFKAEKQIMFQTYEAEALHGLIFKILSHTNPDLATSVHDDLNKLFTLSNFMPFTSRVRGEKGSAKVLHEGKEYKFRITFLEQNLFTAFITYFVNDPAPLYLNGVQIHPTRILTNDSQEPWCGEASFEDLLAGKAEDRVMLKFVSPTSFRRGERNYLLPASEMVFGSLLSRWQIAGGPELSLTEEDLDCVEVNKYDLKTRAEKFSEYSVKGFTGDCEYWFGNLSAEKRREVLALARFGFYAGVGYKTTMGLGQVRISD